MAKKQPRKKAATLPKRGYSVEEAADYIGVSPRTVRSMIYTGKIPVVSCGRRLILDLQDLNVWLDRNKIRILD
jgi:excisionase family DNA binding protein